MMQVPRQSLQLAALHVPDLVPHPRVNSVLSEEVLAALTLHSGRPTFCLTAVSGHPPEYYAN